jgi:DNA-binding CsgD family transcriptional regulator
VLLGRTLQVGEVDRLLGAARAGHGRSLLVCGEPGIGKTALLRVARERALAAGMAVIEAVGVESEADLPFAALGEVAAPLAGHLVELPQRQAGAIEAALAIGDGAGPVGDRLAGCAGFLGLLRAAARHAPLLVLVDDAHWLDRASAECLGYAARRLDGTRVALLAAARPVADAPPLDGRLADELTLPALGDADALELLRTTAGDLARATTDALLSAAAGNPLALIELPSLLTDEQRRGLQPFEPAPAPGGALWDAFGRQIELLDPDARAAVLIAASSLDRALGPVVLACRDLGIGPAALERAEAAGIVALDDDRVVFAHPLLRAVAYQGAPAPERRRAHTALAERTDPDASAWHRASAALGPDDAVADALEAAADRATARGAYTTVADALERAAELTTDEHTRTVRTFSAGLAASIGGQYVRGAGLLEQASEADDPLMRAAVRDLLALVRVMGGIRDAMENHALLTEEAERVRPLDAATAAFMHADAGVVAVVGGHCRLALESAERALASLPNGASATVRAQVYSILGMGLALRGRADEARDALDRAGALLCEVDPLSPPAQSTGFCLHARLCTGQEARLLEETRALAIAAESGESTGLLPYYALVAADAAYRLGDWDAAERDAEEAVATADHTRQHGPLSIALVIRSRIHAVRGRHDDARADAQRGIDIATPPAYGATVIWGRAALGFLELGLGRAAEAVAELEECERLVEIAGLDDPTIVPWASDLVEAYVQAGRRERADQLAAQYAERAARSGVALPQALAARCRGLTATCADDVDRAFAVALDHHARADAPFERGRTLLAYGSRLHRARRRIEARARLREALAVFEDLGAEPWADRARAELRAAGAVQRATTAPRDELTAQETRVALAVARGATNREVAEELYLSPKTVEFHLSRVFRKLGIRSRTELAVLVAEGEAGLPPDPAERLERSY